MTPADLTHQEEPIVTGRVAGKVALITGAGRGQGRNHAVRLAREGADIIAVDVPGEYLGLDYGMATADDLAETARLVEAEGRRVGAPPAPGRPAPAPPPAGAPRGGPLRRRRVVVAHAAGPPPPP